MNSWQKIVLSALPCIMLGSAQAKEVVTMSEFCKDQTPGKFILEGADDEWTWGMAPIYDEKGKLHIFNSVIPHAGSWIRNSKVIHWTADSIEGPYTLEGDVFSSKDASYHNPQISKVGDKYVMVYLLNIHSDENGSLQEVGMATATSLDGPWTENPNNPIIPASGEMEGHQIVHTSNPTFVETPEGKYRIYFKSMTDRQTKKMAIREMSFAESDSLDGPYVNYAKNPVISYREDLVDIEDPYVFHYEGMYYMILEDRRGVKNLLDGAPLTTSETKSGGYRPGLIYQSKDGVDWGIPKVGYRTNEQYFGHTLARSERPSILWKDGKPEYLFLACHDDLPSAGYYVKLGEWMGEEFAQPSETAE